jgi:hypothetical protein
VLLKKERTEVHSLLPPTAGLRTGFFAHIAARALLFLSQSNASVTSGLSYGSHMYPQVKKMWKSDPLLVDPMPKTSSSGTSIPPSAFGSTGPPCVDPHAALLSRDRSLSAEPLNNTIHSIHLLTGLDLLCFLTVILPCSFSPK